MTERLLSWKRALFWPRHKIEFCRSRLGKSIFIFLGLLFIYDLYCALHDRKWIMLLSVPATYLGIGIIGWGETLIRLMWTRLLARHPLSAQTLNLITLVFLWQVRVAAARKNASLMLRFWCYALYALGLSAYFGWQIDYISLKTSIVVTIYATVLTRGTGLLLAMYAWWKPLKQTI